MRQTWAALAASKHKTRYMTPQQPENLPNGGLILTTCRLFRLARPVAATKPVRIRLAARGQPSALSLAFSVQLLHQHGEHAFDFDGPLRQLFVVVELAQFQISSQ